MQVMAVIQGSGEGAGEWVELMNAESREVQGFILGDMVADAQGMHTHTIMSYSTPGVLHTALFSMAARRVRCYARPASTLTHIISLLNCRGTVAVIGRKASAATCAGHATSFGPVLQFFGIPLISCSMQPGSVMCRWSSGQQGRGCQTPSTGSSLRGRGTSTVGAGTSSGLGMNRPAELGGSIQG